MLMADVQAGRQWIERRFDEIAREFGAPRALTTEDRWRKPDPPGEHDHTMSYYVEIEGHLTQGVVTFRDVDLEIAGTGEPWAREKLGRRIRDALALASSSGGRGWQTRSRREA